MPKFRIGAETFDCLDHALARVFELNDYGTLIHSWGAPPVRVFELSDTELQWHALYRPQSWPQCRDVMRRRGELKSWWTG